MPSSIRCSGGSLGRLASQRGRHNVGGSGAGTRRSGAENRPQRDGRIPLRKITVALIAETVAANAADGRITDAVLDTIEPDGPLWRDVRGLRVTLMGTWIETSAARLSSVGAVSCRAWIAGWRFRHLSATSRGQNKAIAVSIMAFDLHAYEGAIWSR